MGNVQQTVVFCSVTIRIHWGQLEVRGNDGGECGLGEGCRGGSERDGRKVEKRGRQREEVEGQMVTLILWNNLSYDFINFSVLGRSSLLHQLHTPSQVSNILHTLCSRPMDSSSNNITNTGTTASKVKKKLNTRRNLQVLL